MTLKNVSASKDIKAGYFLLFTASTTIVLVLTLFLFFHSTLCDAMASRRFLHNGPPAHPVDVRAIPNAIPKKEPLSLYGNSPLYKVHGKFYHVLPSSAHYKKQGIASWYGRKFHGLSTSSGETYNMLAMTAASKELPLPTYVKVTNLQNNRAVVVKVNDRGPFHENRIIDLSYVAAKKLGMMPKGTALVEVEAINLKSPTVTEEHL